jgi:hypothetical protein
MKRISLGNVKSLSKIRIYMDGASRYCVEIDGSYLDDSKVKGVFDTWNTLDDAMVCAKGISKMFNSMFGVVLIEIGTNEILKID